MGVPGLCKKRPYSFSCAWCMSSESREEHRVVGLVLLFKLVINNSSCIKAPRELFIVLSWLSLQQGWLPRDSSRTYTVLREGKGVWGSHRQKLSFNSSYQSSTAQVCARVTANVRERWSHFQPMKWDCSSSWEDIYGSLEKSHIKLRFPGHLFSLKMQVAHSTVPNKKRV